MSEGKGRDWDNVESMSEKVSDPKVTPLVRPLGPSAAREIVAAINQANFCHSVAEDCTDTGHVLFRGRNKGEPR
jgi:hypothetical protein